MIPPPGLTKSRLATGSGFATNTRSSTPLLLVNTGGSASSAASLAASGAIDRTADAIATLKQAFNRRDFIIDQPHRLRECCHRVKFFHNARMTETVRPTGITLIWT